MKRFRFGAALALLLAVAACAPGTNTNGTPTNASEQVAAGLYSTYIAADSAWLSWVLAGKATAAQKAAIDPPRLKARVALDIFAEASKAGNAAAEQVAAQIAVNVLTNTLLAQGVPLTPTKGN